MIRGILRKKMLYDCLKNVVNTGNTVLYRTEVSHIVVVAHSSQHGEQN